MFICLGYWPWDLGEGALGVRDGAWGDGGANTRGEGVSCALECDNS